MPQSVTVVLPTDISMLLRVLLSTFVLTPIMTYIALPQLTSMMSWWLAGDPPPWKRHRSKGSDV